VARERRPVPVPVTWSTGSYYEPFAGGAAFFFALEPARADAVRPKQRTDDDVPRRRKHTTLSLRLLSGYPYNEEFYYRIRDSAPRAHVSIAARLLYLNRTCWNGLYRVNRQGRFNTAFGRFTNPTICDSERLRAAASCFGAPGSGTAVSRRSSATPSAVTLSTSTRHISPATSKRLPQIQRAAVLLARPAAPGQDSKGAGRATACTSS